MQGYILKVYIWNLTSKKSRIFWEDQLGSHCKMAICVAPIHNKQFCDARHCKLSGSVLQKWGEWLISICTWISLKLLSVIVIPCMIHTWLINISYYENAHEISMACLNNFSFALAVCFIVSSYPRHNNL